MRLRVFLSIVELRTKIVSLSSLAVGASIAMVVSENQRKVLAMQGVVAVLFVAAVFLIDMGTTAFNSFFDFWNGTDRKSSNFESDKVLVHARIPQGHALLTALSLYGFAMILGLVLGVLRGWEVVAIGALGMLVGFLYSGGPRPIATTPFGELFAGGFLGGLLVCLTVWISVGRFDTEVLLFSLPSTFVVASILTVNNTCDKESDKAAGRRTLTILIGSRASTILIFLLGFGAFLLAGILVVHRSASLWTCLPLVAGVLLSSPIYRGMMRRGFHSKTKGPSMNAISRILLVFSVSFCLSLFLCFLT